MKKKILMLILSICFLIPGAFIFSACGGNDNVHATGLEIILKDNTESQNRFSCVKDLQIGNKEAFAMDDVKVYATFSNDTTQLLNKDDYSYTLMRWSEAIDDWTFDSEWDFLNSGETTNTKPGMYKMRFTAGNLSQDLDINILRMHRTNIEISLNQYTSEDLDDFNKVELPDGEDCYEVDFLHNYTNSDSIYFLSAQDLTPINESDKLYSDDVWFTLIENKPDYFNAEDKNAYIANNQVESITSNSFDMYGELLPGEYLVFGFYESTLDYDGGYSENYLKLKINPINIEPISHVRAGASRGIISELVADGKLKDNYRDVHFKYENIKIITHEDGSGGQIEQFDRVVHIGAIEEGTNQYLMVSGFNGTEWIHQSIDDSLEQTIKVHAYKDAGKYHLVEFKSDKKWYKLGTATQISADKVEFVEYHLIEEYKDKVYITAPIYLSISSDNLSDESKLILAGYANKDDILTLNVDIYKHMIKFEYMDEDLDITYGVGSTPSYNSLEYDIEGALSTIQNDYKCIYNLNYNKPTGSNPNGEYQVEVDLVDNPNICFAEHQDFNYRTATFLGHSYTWDYKVIALHPDPVYNSSPLINYLFEQPITIEYTNDLQSNNYSISSYINELYFDYLNVYVYKLQDGDETLNISEMTQHVMKEENLVQDGRLISSLDNAVGTYAVVFSLKNNNTIKWISNLDENDESYINRCIKFQVKKEQNVYVEASNIQFEFEETEFEIDLTEYVQVIQGVELLEDYISVVDSCTLDGFVYETSESCSVDISDTTLILSGVTNEDCICIKISLPSNDEYLQRDIYIALTLIDINA